MKSSFLRSAMLVALGSICSMLMLAASSAFGRTAATAWFLGTSNSAASTTGLSGTVNGPGVSVSNASPTGTAVLGTATAVTQPYQHETAYGLEGVTASGGPNAAGVYGIGTNGADGLLGAGTNGGVGVVGTSTTANGVQGTTASTTADGVLGVNSLGTGLYGNSKASSFQAFRAGVVGTGNADPGGYFMSTSRDGAVAIGPGDVGHQGAGGNGIDAGTARSGASGVFAHWDGSSGTGYGVFATAPTGSVAGYFGGAVRVTGTLTADHGINGMTPHRVAWNWAKDGANQVLNLGASIQLVGLCFSGDGGTALRIRFNNLGGVTASLNYSDIQLDGTTEDRQSGVASGSWGAIVGGTESFAQPGGTGQFVWHSPGETVTGTFDWYADASHCEFYANTETTG